MSFYQNGKGTRKDYLVHRLVAETFISNPYNKPTVNHINEDKTDNRVENLEWATMIEQNHHGTRMKRINYDIRNQNPNYIDKTIRSCIPVNQIDSLGNIVNTFRSLSEAARQTNGISGCICRCCKDNTKTYKNFKWQYAK